MSERNPDDILDLIDSACDDYSVSRDAVRMNAPTSPAAVAFEEYMERCVPTLPAADTGRVAFGEYMVRCLSAEVAVVARDYLDALQRRPEPLPWRAP